jgi:hypothetical protein
VLKIIGLSLVLMLVFESNALAQNNSAASVAKEQCGKIIKNKWEKNGADRYGRQTIQRFIGWVPNGPFPPGKYGSNSFWVFNLVLSRGDDNIEFAVDCVFDRSGRIIGIELRND